MAAMIANSLSSLALEPFGSSYFQLGGTAATLVELYCFMFTKFIVVTARCSSLRSRAAAGAGSNHQEHVKMPEEETA